MTLQEIDEYLQKSLENLYQANGESDWDNELINYSIQHLNSILAGIGSEYKGA